MTTDLRTATRATQHRNLVFTSAGDRSNLRGWLGNDRTFDLWVTYYGADSAGFQDVADFHCFRQGSKFQNLHYAYQNWRSIFDHYAAIMVMDDDILIDCAGICRLFEIQEQLNLWALQPAFSPKGKISWDITRIRSTARLRYTNFIEMSCPLFRQDKLGAFMAVYDPRLVGYGVDWWFLDALGPNLEGHVAVIDEISCINPRDDSKGGIREIDRLQSMADRVAVWGHISSEYGIQSEARGQIEYRRIRKPPEQALASALANSPDWISFHVRRGASHVLRTMGFRK